MIIFNLLILHALSPADESAIVDADGVEDPNYRIEFSVSGPSRTPTGGRRLLSLGILNNGDRTVVLPVPKYPGTNGTRLLIQIEREDGTEAPPETVRDPLEVPDMIGEPFYVSVPPRSQRFVDQILVPLSHGKYTCRLTLKNDQTSYRQDAWSKGEMGLMMRRTVDVRIPNVWKGVVERSVAFEVYPLDGEALSWSTDELRYWATRDGGNEALLPYLLARTLKETGLNADGRMQDRLSAIRELATLRHEYATEALAEICRALKDDPVLLPQVAGALYDITYSGTGFRALDVMASMARDRSITPSVRMLFIDLLSAFCIDKVISDGKGNTHRISREEKYKAMSHITALIDSMGEEPLEIQDMLRSMENSISIQEHFPDGQ